MSVEAKDVFAELESVPLFMQSLPEDVEDNATIQALQSLMYDGTPQENAENFKEQGNDCFKQKQWIDAVTFYTKAILCDTSGEVEASLILSCYLNRAAAHLEQHNYGKTLKDCAWVITRDPKQVKAWYRSAKASRCLERYEDALDACKRGLKVEAGNVALKNEQRLTEDLIKKLKEKQAKQRLRQLDQWNEEKQLKEAIKLRNASVKNLPKRDERPYRVHFDEAHPGTLNWPLLFLYPVSRQTDLVAIANEAITIGSFLSSVLTEPPHWDKERRYSHVDNVELWVECDEEGRRVFQASNDMELGRVIIGGRCFIDEGVVRITVLAKQSPEREEWLKGKKVEEGDKWDN